MVLDTDLEKQPILIQNSEGKVIWEGILHPNDGTDKMVIRPGIGPQIELPLLDSPPVLSEDRIGVWALFVSIFIFGWVGIRVLRNDDD